MNTLATTPDNRTETLYIADAQVEVFWLAFQALPKEAQLSVHQRLLALSDAPEELTAELESWQVAASEALLNFEALQVVDKRRILRVVGELEPQYVG